MYYMDSLITLAMLFKEFHKGIGNSHLIVFMYSLLYGLRNSISVHFIPISHPDYLSGSKSESCLIMFHSH